jgi:hypothetical protein
MKVITCLKCRYAFKVPNIVELTKCKKCKNTCIYPICGKCLHSRFCHMGENGHLLYCSACKSLCDIEEYNKEHKPTPIQQVMEIGAKKQ